MLKEPLLHFVLLGVLIFLVHAIVAEHGPENDEIVLTSAKQQRLVAAFAATWNRAPSEPEFESILEDWIREEIAYRQGNRDEPRQGRHSHPTQAAPEGRATGWRRLCPWLRRKLRS